MSDRLIVAYLLLAMLASGLGVGVWWLIHNSPRQRMRRYLRSKHEQAKR